MPPCNDIIASVLNVRQIYDQQLPDDGKIWEATRSLGLWNDFAF